MGLQTVPLVLNGSDLEFQIQCQVIEGFQYVQWKGVEMHFYIDM